VSTRRRLRLLMVRLRSRYTAPALLALIGLIAALVLTRGEFWPLALVWMFGVAAFVVLRRLFPSRSAGIVLAALAVVACPLLTFEGGLFLLPAALALLLLRSAPPALTRPAHASPSSLICSCARGGCTLSMLSCRALANSTNDYSAIKSVDRRSAQRAWPSGASAATSPRA